MLNQFARCRVQDIGGNRLEGKTLQFGKKEDLAFFNLDETNPSLLVCNFVKEQVARLPDLNGTDTKWSLSNIYDPNCEAVCQNDDTMTFTCSSFFAPLRNLSASKRWNYTLVIEEPNVSAGSGQTEASKAEGLSFQVSANFGK